MYISNNKEIIIRELRKEIDEFNINECIFNSSIKYLKDIKILPDNINTTGLKMIPLVCINIEISNRYNIEFVTDISEFPIFLTILDDKGNLIKSKKI